MDTSLEYVLGDEGAEILQGPPPDMETVKFLTIQFVNFILFAQ